MKISWKNPEHRSALIFAFVLLWPFFLTFTVTAEPSPILWGGFFIIWYIAVQCLPIRENEPLWVRIYLRLYLSLWCLMAGGMAIALACVLLACEDWLRHFPH